MLDLLARHSRIDITVKAKGDLHIDHHHTTEDVGIALGQAVKQALGDMKGITRYADVHVPMDEALTRVAIDISGRPFLVFKAEFVRDKVGTFDTELVQEWFQAFAMNAGVTLHVETLYGTNDHHLANPASRVWRGPCGRRSRSTRAPPTRFRRPRVRSVADIPDAQASEMYIIMAVYTVHEPAATKAEKSAPDPERFVFVRDGFSFWAFLLGPLWMLRHRMWLVLLGYVLVVIALEVAQQALRVSSSATFIVSLLLMLLVGFEAATLRRFTLGRRKWVNVGVIVGDDIEAAERRFFDAWVQSGAPTPALQVAPALRPPPSGTTDVIGLFPQPGARR